MGVLRNRIHSIVRGKKLQLLATSLRYPEAAYSTGFNFFGAYTSLAPTLCFAAVQQAIERSRH